MDSVRIVQFSDLHLLADPQGTVRGARTLPRLQACLEHARRNAFPADALVLSGDLVQDDLAAYGTVELLFDNLDIPVLLIPGNHDVPDEMQRRFARAPFRFGGCHRLGAWAVVLLDSWFAEALDGEGRLGPARLAELESTLHGLEAEHACLIIHHPPIPLEAAGMDRLRLQDGEQLLAAVGRHPKVRAVAWGHAHQSLDVYRPGPLRLMCSPATSMQFKPRVDGFVIDERPPGYRVIDLQADGGIATEVVWLEHYRD
ncbi:MAG TPA: metallophosphoesterase [Steroidobacteraceae bacterium]|nr:metallophosphoesterase [Steroidobacteraceae bacterium]